MVIELDGVEQRPNGLFHALQPSQALQLYPGLSAEQNICMKKAGENTPILPTLGTHNYITTYLY